MASDFLLEIDGIKGESKDAKHPGTLEITSFSWHESNPGSFSMGTGGGSGKVSLGNFSFTTQLSAASPSLMKSCSTGDHIKKATLFVRKQGGEQLDYYVWKFTDLIVTSFSTSGADGSGGMPQESIAFDYGKIEINYQTQDDKGVLSSPNIFTYDQRTKTS